MNPESPKPSEWWKWPLMPLASIFGAFLGSMAFLLLNWLGMKISGGFSEDGWYFRYILPFFGSCVFGFLWVRIASVVAPSAKVQASIVMATILCTLQVLVTAFLWIKPDEPVRYAIQSTAFGIGTIVAAVISTVDVAERVKKSS